LPTIRQLVSRPRGRLSLILDLWHNPRVVSIGAR
jgi:hypothetical protein